MRLADLDQLARRQHGVVEFGQTNLTSSAWQRATTNGTLIPMHRRVARLAGTAATPQQTMMAAVLATGPGAMVSHRSAAFLHGMAPGTPRVVDLIVPTSKSGHVRDRTAWVRGLDGVVPHRPSDRRRLTPHRVDNIACTNVLRTLLDLGAVAPDAVPGAVGHALTTRLATLDAIATCLFEHGRPGRAGIGALRRALDEWTIDAKPADSVLEPAMRRLIANYGLPPVEFHALVGGREVDFRVIGTPVVIECDGWAFHGRDREQFERDRRNDAEFTAHGWIVLRFTYRAITTQPGRVAAQIRATINRWAGANDPDVA